MGKTAEQVNSGLAVLYIIEEENSLNLDIPNTYGLDAIHLTIQDKTFTNGKMNKYKTSTGTITEWQKEDTILVNGVLKQNNYLREG